VTLVTGLSISASDARNRCAAWLAESQALVRQREELLDRKARLAEARMELLEVPGVSAMRDKMTDVRKKQRSGRRLNVAGPVQVPVPSSAAMMPTPEPVPSVSFLVSK
jgi:hypothetical protein